MNRRALMDVIMSADGLINSLHAGGCITSRQREVLDRQSFSERTEKLLDLLTRESLADLDIFISCLPETAQHRVLCLINASAGNFTASLFITCRCLSVLLLFFYGFRNRIYRAEIICVLFAHLFVPKRKVSSLLEYFCGEDKGLLYSLNEITKPNNSSISHVVKRQHSN